MIQNRLIILFISGLLSAVAYGQVDTVQVNERMINTLPTVTLSQSELDGYDQGQDISGLLQSSRDIFASTAGYTFGSARFRMRGYDTENTQVMINGVLMNDMETGRAFWSSWGGLNDAFRSQENYLGLSTNDFGFGGIGGLTYLDVRASQFSRGVKATYSLTNQSYRNRIMVIASTGKMKNGWAVTVSGSRRWSKEGYVEGTFYDAWSYFLSVEKELSPSHSIGFVGFGAPVKRGQNGLSVQEANDLAGTNYYNPYWGYQNGEKRNSRVSNYHQPMLMLNHYWTFDPDTKLTSALSYSFGRGGSSALNWTEAGDPRPDYYRNLPSYYRDLGDQEQADLLTDLWENNDAYRQIDWDAFYFANSKFLYTVSDADGITGNAVTGNRSKFIIEDRRSDRSQVEFTSRLQKKFSDHLVFTTGINLNGYKGFHFNVVNDLLGGDFWLDVDKYADQDP
ncbi:MAG TPA: Plug domain-containing protein, partial [Bacteroidales bacterium]|nr:Plug domain-containing protein [Bacteroidales bacterium]